MKKNKQPRQAVPNSGITRRDILDCIGRRLLYLALALVPGVWGWEKTGVAAIASLAGVLLALYQAALLLSDLGALIDDFFPLPAPSEQTPRPLDKGIYRTAQGLFVVGMVFLAEEVNWMIGTVGGRVLFWKFAFLGILLALVILALLWWISPSVYRESGRRQGVLFSLLLGLFMLCPAAASCINRCLLEEGPVHCQSYRIEQKRIGGKRKNVYWIYLRVREGALERFEAPEDLYARRTEGQRVELCARPGRLGYAVVTELQDVDQE